MSSLLTIHYFLHSQLRKIHQEEASNPQALSPGIPYLDHTFSTYGLGAPNSFSHNHEAGPDKRHWRSLYIDMDKKDRFLL